MDDRELARSDGLVVRRRETPVVWSRADRFRERLDQSKLRLREAVALVKESAREMTPAARIESHPMTWVLGGFAVGLALGWLTSRRKYVGD
jgi:ElaB/YqjD/DUF883 family membrane-anchored ribosome-binding protein